MYLLLPAILLFVLCIFLFFWEIKLDHKRFLEEHRLADEHILREVERFKKQMELQH
jgi:nitrogen fixation-related uncharacterized protein